MSLIFNEKNFTVREMEADGIIIRFRAFEHLVTVKNASIPECQQINIYVPECFYNGECVNGYSLHDAPIFFEVDMGGFFPSSPKRPEDERFKRTSIFFYCLHHGYVVVSAGCRGRMSRDSEGQLCGKLPAAIIDCKMALRYLHFNQKRLPGNVNRIIVSGTSAGGGVAIHMGLYKSNQYFEKEFIKFGAADAQDNVLAVAAYCPVTDLEHVDMAYEWQFNGIYDYHRMTMDMDEGGRPNFSKEDGVLSEERCRISKELADMFRDYVNGFNFISQTGTILRLDEDGRGTFSDWILRKLQDGALRAGISHMNANEAYQEGTCPQSFYEYMKFITRMKLAPAFDDITMDSFENNAFGGKNNDYAHFTKFSYDHSKSSEPVMASLESLYLSNPHNFIDGRKARFFRIRQGSKDRDIGMGTTAVLALHLQQAGACVEYGIDWGEQHGGDYDALELFRWIDTIIVKEAATMIALS